MRQFASRTLLTGLAAVMLLSGAVAVARAQVMQQVPADALVVIKVKNLKATSGKVGKLLTDFGIAAAAPGLDDPLTFLQRQLNIKQGLNTDGELAFVYRDPDVIKARPDQSMLFLIPVTDYKAFLTNFPGAKTDGDVTEVHFGPQQQQKQGATKPAGAGDDADADQDEDRPRGGGHKEPGYFVKWGNYAALSPNKLAVSTKPTAMLKINGKATTRELDAKDVIVLANFQALRTRFTPALQSSREEVLAMVEQGMAREEKAAKYAPAAKALVGQLFAVAEGFLRDTEAATFGINFAAEGVNFTTMAEFIPDSYLGKNFGSVKNTDRPLLAGLPQGKYLFYGGGISDPKLTSTLMNDFLAPVEKELNAIGPEVKPVQDYITALKDYVKSNNGTTFGLVAPEGNLGKEAILQILSINRGDPAAMRTAQQRMMTSQEEIMKMFGMPEGSYKVTVTNSAKTVDGVSFDQITTTMNSNDPAGRQQQDIMNMVYGPGGINMWFATVGNDTLLIASGVPDPVLSSTITAVKANDAPLTKQTTIQSVAANLPKQRTAEFYIPLDTIAMTGVTYAKAMGAGVPQFNLPEDLPPIGATGSIDGTAVRIDAYVPTSLVQSLVSASMQVYMQMQGGGQPGGPRGL